MKVLPDGLATMATGVLVVILGGLIVLSGVGSQFHPPRPSYGVSWGIVGALVMLLGAWITSSGLREWRSGRS